MKKLSTLYLLLLVLLCLSACSRNTNTKNNIIMPAVSLKSTGETITPAFYNNDFDFDYDNLPELILSNEKDVLLIELGDNFNSTVNVGEDYYTYTSNTGICERGTYTLEKDDKDIVSLPIERRGNLKDEKSIYYIKNDEGKFVFKIFLPID